ncbi:MAG: DEAD/DEAH box helicase family protein [Planctomycetaceae bacterium]
MDKSSFSEREICSKIITPALQLAGWDLQTQIREELTGQTPGRVEVCGSRTRRRKGKRADYVLEIKPGIPVAVIEAKKNKFPVGHGMPQALGYSEMFQVPFAFSSNGDGFLFHDKTAPGGPTETNLTLDQFPSPADLWHRYCQWRGISDQSRPIVEFDYHNDGSGKGPRYYQKNAINRTIEAIANGQDRILLVMATGTGKTYTAFQIIWRLWKSGTKKRILFLADRNILVDQTMVNDFKPFKGAMAKLSTRSKTIEKDDGTEETIPTAISGKKRQVDTSYEIYMSLYQAITGPEERQKIYKSMSPDFFDLIIIDECHRGSAAEDSAWREILDYFSSATHIGLTATPKETEYVSNINYFGDPVYQYTLKQGIDDGFLAPYKVVRIDFDKDLEGWRPTPGQTDKHGNPVEDRIYNQKDIDRNIVFDKRTQLVAAKITEFLKGTDRFAKTIVFCEDIEHAERMRQALVNANSDLVAEHPRYVVRITGDNTEGKMELDNFINPEDRFPVIATTSKLMTTGVDAKTCKLIVLDQRIQSMTEFKQIIGRGTRIDEDHGKRFFTIMDFKKATELFADPEFDGDPVQVYVPGPDDPPVPPEDPAESTGEDDDTETEPEVNSDGEFTEGGFQDDGWTDDGVGPTTTGTGKREKVYINDIEFSVVGERVQYMDGDGKLVTESIKDFSRKGILKEYSTLDEFLKHWNDAERKQAIVEELENEGVFFDELQKIVGADYGPFDLICHVAFDQPPLSRKERAENVRKRNYFTKYGDEARAVLQALLSKYADEGIDDIESMEVLKVQPLSSFGTPIEIVKLFGTKQDYLRALKELEAEMYAEVG